MPTIRLTVMPSKNLINLPEENILRLKHLDKQNWDFIEVTKQTE